VTQENHPGHFLIRIPKGFDPSILFHNRILVVAIGGLEPQHYECEFECIHK
jgi:hypothetical protein